MAVNPRFRRDVDLLPGEKVIAPSSDVIRCNTVHESESSSLGSIALAEMRNVICVPSGKTMTLTISSATRAIGIGKIGIDGILY